MGLDSIRQAGLGRTSAKHPEHPGLHVDADDLAAGADHFSYRQAEKAHRAADVQYGHAGSDVRRKNLVRILQELPEPVGQEVTCPYGAHMFRHKRSSYPISRNTHIVYTEAL
jgi:hypothetical protein